MVAAETGEIDATVGAKKILWAVFCNISSGFRLWLRKSMALSVESVAVFDSGLNNHWQFSVKSMAVFDFG